MPGIRCIRMEYNALIIFHDCGHGAERKAELVGRGFLGASGADTLEKIRKECNFSAHYFEVKRDKFHDYIEQVATLSSQAPSLPKLFTTELENKNLLGSVIGILMRLHENYLVQYNVPL